MHLQEGIGRGGYRWLATVFVALGVLGLVTTLYAFKTGQVRGGFFDWLGFALSFVALMLLYATLQILLASKAAPAANAPSVPAGAPTFTPTRQLDFEFKVEDDEDMGHGPEVAVPMREVAAPAPSPKVVLPPNRNLGRDAKGWPERHGPSGMTRGEWKEQQGSPSPRAPRSVTKSSAAILEPDPGVPVVIARIGDAKDDPNWTPTGMARGKCGGCGALLLAPPERPIRLRCPKCDKETMLR